MRQSVWFGLGILVTFMLIAVMLLTGWLLVGSRVRAMPMVGRMGVFGRAVSSCFGDAPSGTITSTPITAERALANFEHYLVRFQYEDLAVAEVMEFEHNFYAIIVDTQTGIGFMELLADRNLGTVSQEMGPNMMWNDNGMHGGMMGGMIGRDPRTTTNRLSETEALQSAQSWLTVNDPELHVGEHADAFSGYYTLHTFKDGEIAGMLSVHGDTGQVWYHSWHGEYVDMLDLGHEETDH